MRAAASLEQLVAFRVLQGLGAGLITPIGSAILYRAYPVHERATAAAAVVGVAVIAPALGPVLGGLIIETASWQWIFYVNLPIGAVAILLGAAWLEEYDGADAGRFDAAGVVLGGGGLALLLYALSIAPDEGWSAPVTVLTGGAAVAAFVVLVIVELRLDEPMLNLRLFGERLFRTVNIAGLFTYAGFLAQIFVFTLYLQSLRGFSALDAGLTQSPQAVGVFVFSNLAGRRLYQRVGPRRMMVVGTAGAGAATASVARATLDTPLSVLALVMFGRGLFMGMVFVAIQTAVYARVPGPQMAQATPLFNTQRQAANAIGVAVAATVLAALAPETSGPTAQGLTAYRWTFVTSALMFVPGFIASLTIHDEDAAATRSSSAAARPRPAPGAGGAR